jgi:single-strand DNA-binding protein
MPRRKSTTAPAPEPEAAAPETVAEEPTVLTVRLTADPALRHTRSGLPVTTLRVAVQGTEPPQFMDVVLFRRNAEVACLYLKKGRLVEVTSSRAPHERTWTGEDGTDRRTTEVVAYRVQFLSDRGVAPVSEKEVA